jgi:dihydrofolate reductase
MRSLVSFMHVSLDGFVCGPNGEMDWIKVDDEIFDYAGNRTSQSDTALYGRVTWEMMDAYWPTAPDKPNASKHDIEHGNWYNKVDKVILSNTMKGKQLPNTVIISDDVEHRVKALKQQAGKEIIMFGSPGATHSLTQLGLIDEYWLFLNPVLVGKGTRLFETVPEMTQLKLVETRKFECGVVCVHYKKA